jgi:hypothetical protein
MGILRRRDRQPVRAISVDEDMVSCPLASGDMVDIERCYACGLLERMSTTDGQDWITCRGTARGISPLLMS